MTPFPLPAPLRARLRKPASDGNWYLDFKSRDRWDGIIVANRDGIVIGIYVGRRIRQWNLPPPEEMEDVRHASIMHRVLASLPDSVVECLFWAPLISFAVGGALMAARLHFLAAATALLGMTPILKFPRAYCLTGCPMLVGAAGTIIVNTILGVRSWMH